MVIVLLGSNARHLLVTPPLIIFPFIVALAEQLVNVLGGRLIPLDDLLHNQGCAQED